MGFPSADQPGRPVAPPTPTNPRTASPARSIHHLAAPRIGSAYRVRSSAARCRAASSAARFSSAAFPAGAVRMNDATDVRKLLFQRSPLAGPTDEATARPCPRIIVLPKASRRGLLRRARAERIAPLAERKPAVNTGLPHTDASRQALRSPPCAENPYCSTGELEKAKSFIPSAGPPLLQRALGTIRATRRRRGSPREACRIRPSEKR